MGYIDSLKKDGFPELRALLAMGGIDMREQVGHILMALCSVCSEETATTRPSGNLCHQRQAVLRR